MKNMLLVLVVLAVLLAGLSFGTELAGTLSSQQEQKMEEVASLTRQEMKRMQKDLAAVNIDDASLHGSAPEEQNWIAKLVDEIARWFGLN